MSRRKRHAVLTVRVAPDLGRRIEQEARRRRTTKSALLRRVLQSVFGEGVPQDEAAQEARRQSLLVSNQVSEREAFEFIEQRADEQGWQ